MKKLVIATLLTPLYFVYAAGQESNFSNLQTNNQKQLQTWVTNSNAQNRVENLRTALEWNTLSLQDTDEKNNTLLHTFALKADPEMLEVIASFCNNEMFNKKNKEEETPHTIINNQVKELFFLNENNSTNGSTFDQEKLQRLIACKQILRKYSSTLPTFSPILYVDNLKFALNHSVILPTEPLDEYGNTILHHFAMNPRENAILCLKNIPPEAFLQKNKQNKAPLNIAQERMAQLLKVQQGNELYESYQKGFKFIEQKTKEAENPSNEPEDSCCIIV